MNLYKKIALAFSFCLVNIALFAQTPVNTASQQNGWMNEGGKIYVVVAVVLVILIGLFIYLFSLDRKLSKLEKSNNKPT